MNRIINIIQKFTKNSFKIKDFLQTNFIQLEPPKSLGRWKINYCSKTMNSKVDLANEDHCGPCGQYAISKKEKDQPTIK